MHLQASLMYPSRARVLAAGSDVWRREEKVDRIVSLLCEEFFLKEGGYFYDFWFGCEEPKYANQL